MSGTQKLRRGQGRRAHYHFLRASSSVMARGGMASRRFVWAAYGVILCTRLALRSGATQDTTPTITQAAISACTTEKVRSDVHAKPTEESDWPLPVASNLLTFHGGIACAYNHISGELMRSLDVWRPNFRG
jgi:hypothetical protein